MEFIKSKTILSKVKYNCLVPNYKRLYEIFKIYCDKYGIIYKMEDIINSYKKDVNNNEQIMLF